MMFANDKSIDNLQDLFKEFRKYIKLQGEYIKLDVLEKLIILLSTLTLAFILLMLGIMALFYFSFMLVYVLSSVTDSLTSAYAIVGSILIMVAFIIYYFRNYLIFQPIANFLAHLFLDDSNKKDPQ